MSINLTNRFAIKQLILAALEAKINPGFLVQVPYVVSEMRGIVPDETISRESSLFIGETIMEICASTPQICRNCNVRTEIRLSTREDGVVCLEFSCNSCADYHFFYSNGRIGYLNYDALRTASKISRRKDAMLNIVISKENKGDCVVFITDQEDGSKPILYINQWIATSSDVVREKYNEAKKTLLKRDAMKDVRKDVLGILSNRETNGVAL